MPPLDTPENIRLEGMERYRLAEVRIRKAQEAVLDIIPVIAAGQQAGMLGELRAKRMIAELKSAAGDQCVSEARIWKSHEESTQICKDIGLEFQTEGGGTR